jgi:hypothetical protein
MQSPAKNPARPSLQQVCSWSRTGTGKDIGTAMDSSLRPSEDWSARHSHFPKASLFTTNGILLTSPP